MLKATRPQRHILKINSKRLRRHNWKLTLTREEAFANGELIALGESQVLRMIDEMVNKKSTIANRYFKIKDHIEKLQNQETSNKNKKKISKLYDKIDDLLFEKNYIMIVFNTKDDYKKAVRNGVYINNVKFKRLYGTTVGIKKNTIIFVSENIHEDLYKKIENDRNPNVKIVPAKYEAYMSLCSSVSEPVGLDILKSEEILVVHDHITKFKSDATEVKSCKGDEPIIENIEDMDMELEQSDGNGIIRPDLSEEFAKILGQDYIPSGFCIRNSFCKGMVYSFPINEWVDKIAIQKYGKNSIVKDVWGNNRDVRNVKLILTTSMLKLWNAYDSMSHYLECCKKNGHEFSVTKVIPRELENERYMTYQFLQSLHLDDSQIHELVKPTIDELKDVLGGDYRKSVLYLRGKNMTDENIQLNDADFIQALMIDNRMIDDPFVKHRIYNMLQKSIDQAKVGVVKIRGNYTHIAGDIYGLAEYIFGIEGKNGKVGEGLLNANEFYSNYWNKRNVKKVVAMRAPMCTHANIRILKLKNNKELSYWYRYMPNCTIFNSWDSTCESLSGCDKDGDSIITTDNNIIMDGVRDLPPLICKLGNVDKEIVNQRLLEKSNLNGFNNNVGSVTNRATSIRNKMCLFEEDSPEYIELEKREMAIQRIQQSVIDSIKTGKSEKIPKSWYSYSANKIITQEMVDKQIKLEKEKENDCKRKNEEYIPPKVLLKADTEDIVNKKMFNLKILADKKPYFMIYIYNNLKKKYKQYIESCNVHSLRRFSLTLDELLKLDDKNDSQKLFVEWYYKKLPTDNAPSLMNKICWLVENEFLNILKPKEKEFDYKILMTDTGYNTENYKKIQTLYREYKKKVQSYMIDNSIQRMDSDDLKKSRRVFLFEFRKKAYKICSGAEELCNIVVDICYRSEGSKQFAWDISGRQIIKNLLSKNNNEITYFEKDDNGDIEYAGDRFTLKKKHVTEEELNGYNS